MLRRLTVFNTLITVLVIMSALPAKADMNTNNLKSFVQQFEEAFNSLKTYINLYGDEFSQGWGELNNELNQAIDSSIGNLGIPDPLKAGKKISDVISKQKTDITVTPPGIQGQDAQRQWHQQYTLGQSEAVLGTEGQKVQAQQADMSNYAVSTSSNNANAAQEDIVTQDILKKMAVQNSQEVMITKSIHEEAQKQTQALAAANINLTDISGRMDEQAKRQELANAASAKRMLESAAFADGFWEKQ